MVRRIHKGLFDDAVGSTSNMQTSQVLQAVNQGIDLCRVVGRDLLQLEAVRRWDQIESRHAASGDFPAGASLSGDQRLLLVSGHR